MPVSVYSGSLSLDDVAECSLTKLRVGVLWENWIAVFKVKMKIQNEPFFTNLVASSWVGALADL